MDSGQFEELVANVWSEMGWSTRVSPPGRDQGIDVVATKSNLVDEKAIIQVKRYSEGNKVGRPEIQQYSSLKNQFPDADSVIVVTSSGFTNEAIQLAHQLGVKIVDGEELAEACILNLSETTLSQLVNRGSLSNQNTKTANSREVNQIQIDDLSESERDLANFYSGYLRRLSEAIQDGSYERSFFISVDREYGESSEYTVHGVVHHIQFPAESPKLLAQLQKTARKYGWRVAGTETYGSGAGGVEMIVPPEEANMFRISIDTRMSDSPIPERQARIINLILDRVYNQDLSGTEITDLVLGAYGNHSLKSPTRVIK